MILIRKAIWLEHKLQLTYQDLKDKNSQRVIWPLALGFFDEVRILIAWCELRQDFHHFRTDRIIELHEIGKRYPARRQVLLKRWRTVNKIPH